MLPHAEIIIGAPDRHVGTETMFQCARELADAALQFSEHPVPPFHFQCVEACRKELLAPFRSVAHDRRGRPLIVCLDLRHGILAIDWFARQGRDCDRSASAGPDHYGSTRILHGRSTPVRWTPKFPHRPRGCWKASGP